MYPKDMVDDVIPRKDDKGKPLGPPIIKLEFKKDYLDPYIYMHLIKNQEKKTNPM